MTMKPAYELPKGRTDDEIVVALEQCLDREAERIEQTVALLAGGNPKWLTPRQAEEAREIASVLLNGYSPELIAKFVDEAGRNELTFPGTARDSSLFAHVIYKLVRIFKRGRWAGTRGPIRKWIAGQLAKNPAMKNPNLWGAFKAKPLRGWQAMENSLGLYLEGPRAKNGKLQEMGYGRFCTVAGKERKKLNG